MTLKGDGPGPLPPLLEQYVELRERHPDYLLLFQVGDFYECFGEDAERLARLLGVALTHKTSRDFTTPMAGVPVRAADGHVERLLQRGARVAIADQVENAADADGLVRREVTQLVTPGTVTDERLLQRDATYLAAIATGDGYGLALLDLSTGEFRGAHVWGRGALFDELLRYRPAEVLLAPELEANEGFRATLAQQLPVMLSSGRFDAEAATAAIVEQFGALPPDVDPPALRRAAGAVLSYARDTQRGALPQVGGFVRYDPGAFMRLDETTLATLEVFEPRMPGGRTLLGALDATRTAPGRRLLRSWLRHPLLEPAPLEVRQDAVEALLRDAPLRTRVRRALHRVFDLERLAARLAARRADARDLAALARSAERIPELQGALAAREERALRTLLARCGDLDDPAALVRAALVDDPPAKITEGGLIRSGFDRDLDAERDRADRGRAWLAELEASERAATGIPTLKIGFNGVFGYYLEVTRPHLARVPESWRAVQTLKDRQRYTRPDLQGKEREILRAEERARRREYEVFSALRAELAAHAGRVRDAGAALAELDVYAALAEVAAEHGYRRPFFTPGGAAAGGSDRIGGTSLEAGGGATGESGERRLELRASRHPVVERHRPFLPNDAELHEGARLTVLTGPNMSGKSTYLRQIALCALLAQVGSFVPAERARLPVFDRIFTRIGASDDLAGGRSTFFVEMEELARILHQAGPRSLVLLDEVGRGTSTFDGLALAWAATEHLHDRAGAFTLFATHYAELTALAERLPAARNLHVAAREEAGDLVFYHQVRPGPAAKAYGLEVARMAGVPPEVVARARGVFETLEAEREGAAAELLERLLARDLGRLTPLEALTLLHELQALARGAVLEP